jgi:hypothetical protein
MDDLHLLHDGGLSRFAGAKQQQLDLLLRAVLVRFELKRGAYDYETRS